MDYSKPPKFTIFSKTKARIVGTTLAILIPATFFYYAFKSHFFHLNRAFSDIHMVTVGVVAADSAASYPLIELSEAEICAVLVEPVVSSSSTSSHAFSSQEASRTAQSSISVTPSSALSSVASSTPEFALPNALAPLGVAPQCLKSLAFPAAMPPEGRDGIMTLELTINKAGQVYRVDILKSSGVDALDKTTSEQLINNWHLEPCYSDAKEIECKRQVRVRWRSINQ